MPRTKAPARKPKVNKKTAILANDRIKQIEEFREQINEELDSAKEKFFEKINAHFRASLLEIPFNIANKTVAELKNKINNCSSMASTTASIMNILEVTKTRKRVRTSKSSCDEAESVSGNSGGNRQSRSKVRQPKAPRVSRSLTANRTIAKKPTTRASSSSKYKTPANKVPNPSTYATVTPKDVVPHNVGSGMKLVVAAHMDVWQRNCCPTDSLKVKPNTPQVLLRRPQVGEMALSLQGSPLFTGSVVSETIANVNIPLEGGRMLSIQPKRGLRASQIPELDAETKRQLQMLRENLNKVCAAAGVSH